MVPFVAQALSDLHALVACVCVCVGKFVHVATHSRFIVPCFVCLCVYLCVCCCAITKTRASHVYHFYFQNVV